MATITSADALKWFGNPKTAEAKWCTLWNKPKNCSIPTVPARIYMHKLVIPYWDDVYREICDKKLGFLIETWDGCFNIRQKKGIKNGKQVFLNEWSLHSWALAIDCNASKNPQGKKGHQDTRLVKVFEDNGFENAAKWKTPDPMHWQLTREVMVSELIRLNIKP